MKKLIVLLVIALFAGFMPKDYANTTAIKVDYETIVNNNLNSIETIDDVYEFFKHLDALNISVDNYKDNVFDIVALNYKAKYLNYSNYKKQTFIDSIFSKEHIKYALEGQLKYDIPASVTLAQAYLESKKNGKYEFSNHVKHTNNLFGIKYTNSKYVIDKYYIYTQEELTQAQLNKIKSRYNYTVLRKVGNKYRIRIKDSFAVFNGPDKSFKYHNEILNGYKLDANSYYEWTLGLVENGYATGSGYSNLLNSIIQEYKLYELDYYVN